MMATIIARNMATITTNLMGRSALTVWVQICPKTNGNWLRIETKMISDIPFPTPRCVISSPSHMTMAVPAVMVSTISTTRPGV